MEMVENVTVMRTSALTEKIEDVLAHFPENPLTHLFAHFWTWMSSNFSEQFIFTYLPVLMHEGLFFLGALPTFLCQFIPFMKRYKIQGHHEEKAVDQWEALKLIAFNHFCTQVPLIVLPPTLKSWYNIPYDWDSMPRWYVIMVSVYFCAMCEDAWHYMCHRIAHTKPFYTRFHKVHHSFRAPFGLTAEYSHPAEVIVLGSGFFIGLMFVCQHMSIMFAWVVLRILVNVDGHCGYDFPFSPLKLIPFYAGPRIHDFHHSHNNANFASTFIWWDWLLGTDKPYRRYLQRQAAAAGEMKKD